MVIVSVWRSSCIGSWNRPFRTLASRPPTVTAALAGITVPATWSWRTPREAPSVGAVIDSVTLWGGGAPLPPHPAATQASATQAPNRTVLRRAGISPNTASLGSTGRRNAVWSVTLKVGTDSWIGLGGAAVVAEARAERVPEWR
jgi:hypothetical protein